MTPLITALTSTTTKRISPLTTLKTFTIKSPPSKLISYPRTPPKTPPFRPILKGLKLPKQTFGKFPVFARRFGKWKSIGFGSTKEQALLLGKRYSQKTLGRSFYVPGMKPQQLLPGFRTKIEKGKGLIYIQKTGKGLLSTLGSAGEKAEIKFYRGLKMKNLKGGKR